ncbi:unnamed protein product [Ophioblennius macclurei]
MAAAATDELQTKVFHDPVHGQIELHPLLVKIIDTPQFQRLRSLKQLGGASFVYPGACHTRFEHSIGVAYLAGELVKALRSRQPELNIDDKDVLCVQIAGLCHDLGHGPFSHLFDHMPKPKASDDEKKWTHEDASVDMFDHLVEENGLEMETEYNLDGRDLTFIKEMMNPQKDQEPWPFKGRGEDKSFLYEIVANKLNGLDVDKFDYLERDCLHVGLKTVFDCRRFFLFARVCMVKKSHDEECEVEKSHDKKFEVKERRHICLREKEMSNLYDMFFMRYTLHRKVYQHKVTKNVELMIMDALLKADKDRKITGAIDDMKKYTNLTDEIFEKILHSDKEDLKEAREILQMIQKRKLYKFVGEAKNVNGVYQTQEQINQTITEIQTELESPDQIEVCSFVYDYGNRDQDPMDNTYFYRKTAPNEAFSIPQNRRSSLLPDHFSERLFRVYWKVTGDDEETQNMLKNLKRRFSEWCGKQKNLIETQLYPGDDSDHILEFTDKLR